MILDVPSAGFTSLVILMSIWAVDITIVNNWEDIYIIFSFDLYDECGIFALCAMTPFLIRLLVGLFKLQKRNIDIADRIGLIAWFAVIAILFMTEPVLYYGRTNLMAFFFFMAGIVEFSGALAYKEEHLSDAR